MKKFYGVLKWNIPNFVLVVIFIFTVVSLFNGIIVNAEEQTPVTTVTEKTLFVGHEGYKIELKNLASKAIITYKSSNNAIATVSNNGTIKSIAAGEAKVTILIKQNGKKYSLAIAVTVKAIAPELVTSIAEIHTAEILKLSVRNYSGNITWATSDPYIATVDKNGIVTGRHKAGVAIITAKTSDMSLSCKITNISTMRDIPAKELVSKMKIGSNFASSLDYIGSSYKTGYNDYDNSSSEVNIAFTLWEPGKDYYYSDLGVSMRKGDSLHQTIPLKSLDKCNPLLKLSKAVIQTYYPGNIDGKMTIKVSNAKITVGKMVYKLDYLNGTHTMTMYAEKNTSNGIYNCGNSVGDKASSSLPNLPKLVGGIFEADIKIVDLHEPGGTDKATYKTTYYLSNEGMNKLPRKEMVDALKKAGYDAVRLTVSWTPHMNDSTYIIDKAWFDKVEEQVNWVLENDMYCIINAHYDYLNTSWVGDHWSEAWMLPKYQAYVDAKYTAMWKQIADKFKDYDDYLLFENMNEPNMKYETFIAEGGNPEDYEETMIDRVNAFNDIFYSVVQKSGSNNSKRFVMLTCTMEKTQYLEYLKLPVSDKVIATAHTYYVPFEDEKYDNGKDEGGSYRSLVDKDMERISAFIEETGVPVIIGEFGNTKEIVNNERINQAVYLVQKAKEIGVPCLWWECAVLKWEEDKTVFSLYDRDNMKWEHMDILQAIINAAKDQ